MKVEYDTYNIRTDRRGSETVCSNRGPRMRRSVKICCKRGVMKNRLGQQQ